MYMHMIIKYITGVCIYIIGSLQDAKLLSRTFCFQRDSLAGEKISDGNLCFSTVRWCSFIAPKFLCVDCAWCCPSASVQTIAHAQGGVPCVRDLWNVDYVRIFLHASDDLSLFYSYTSLQHAISRSVQQPGPVIVAINVRDQIYWMLEYIILCSGKNCTFSSNVFLPHVIR